MAFFQLSKPPSPAVPCGPSTIVLFLACLLLLSSSHLRSCTCSDSQQDPFLLDSGGEGNLTMSGAFDQLPGYLFLTNMSTCRTNYWETVRGLNSYIKTNHPALDLSQKGWFFVRQIIALWEEQRYSGDVLEASFSVAFTLSSYRPNSSLIFAIEPLYYPTIFSAGRFIPPNWQVLGPSSSSNSSSSVAFGSRTVSVEIGRAEDNGTSLYLSDIIWVQIRIEEPPGNNSSVPSKYSVWIDYDHVRRRISVYVAAGGEEEEEPKPVNTIASKDLSTSGQYALVGFFSSLGQLLQVHTWNSTVDGLPYFGVDPGIATEKTIILYSVLGSAAVAGITAAIVILYINSKCRRWKKEQDELAKIMQSIPGVPTHVDFADIKKATKNFHETMKLGKGGFGAVYRCTLPAVASRTRGRATDVAVKKFMRQVDDRRFSDFLAEVSIINRLRHKNIVPLVGWSYNKSEPVLIYEYMTNGSLDQHIFQKASARQQQHHQQQEEDTSIGQWHTRYDIARDIATGLHYVHHEHEPMVLHRDIKASNIMLDSDFRARLGDFGIACTVAVDRSSVTGIAGTWGYIAPDYAMSYKATRQTDIYAFGVLVLEVVTGKKNGDFLPDDDHITDWIWRLHAEGKLLEAVDASVVLDDGVVDEAKRLLLLGLACTNPNPGDRPTMAQVLQVITNVRPPPDVPLEKPLFVWPPRDWWPSGDSVYSTSSDSNWDGSLASTVETAPVSLEHPSSSSAVAGGRASVRSRAMSGSRDER